MVDSTHFLELKGFLEVTVYGRTLNVPIERRLGFAEARNRVMVCR
jgi:hypothetical protein